MCEVATLLAISLAVSTASAGFTARSQVQKGKFQKKTSQYNSRVAENQAQETRNVGTEAENAKRLETARFLAQQKAQLGASNVDIGSGSAFQIQQDTATLGEVDALRIRNNTSSQVSSLTRRSDLLLSQGAAAQSAGFAAAGGTILGGLGDIVSTGVADKWFTSDSAGRIVSDTPFGPAL